MGDCEFEKVVITGIGIVSPFGVRLEDFWATIIEGEDNRVNIPECWNLPYGKTKLIGMIKEFNVKDFLDAPGIRRLIRCSQFALIASKRALEDSGLKDEKTEREKMGIVLGVSWIGLPPKLIKGSSGVDINPIFVPEIAATAPAAHISITFGLGGPNVTVGGVSEASLNAIGYACKLIQYKKSDVILAGGTVELNMAVLCWAHSLEGFLLPDKDGEEKCRPFDLKRNGSFVSEGSVIFVLENIRHALQRDAHIYAEIAGFGTFGEPGIPGAYSSSHFGIQMAIKKALESSKIMPWEINYICAAANGSRTMDRMEILALKDVFKEYAHEVSINSIKGVIGESLTVSGAFNTLTAVLAIKNQIIPPTVNYEKSDSECYLTHILSFAENRRTTTCLVNAISPGGSCASLVLKSFSN